ncbi:hypothetical protein BABINDRAFT_166599 [Babjeviella inositovora NRRL Y-12698]|uniref:Uncharacterized protein n=1 Tax=Babjeviella inositovora NRRL Y-12698 TaxID=984486 RepID=A0A1E3QRA6_9ASCO|nr:uncharacterized protein BABINDRAFT_166599 [Babjeviella inositovora NRRL Y-12698]ODQ80246.1 hypothetical protein BABINDRAFT_166599 [Babjeviella inositovora NRRL Y-12698]
MHREQTGSQKPDPKPEPMEKRAKRAKPKTKESSKNIPKTIEELRGASDTVEAAGTDPKRVYTDEKALKLEAIAKKKEEMERKKEKKKEKADKKKQEVERKKQEMERKQQKREIKKQEMERKKQEREIRKQEREIKKKELEKRKQERAESRQNRERLKQERAERKQQRLAEKMLKEKAQAKRKQEKLELRQQKLLEKELRKRAKQQLKEFLEREKAQSQADRIGVVEGDLVRRMGQKNKQKLKQLEMKRRDELLKSFVEEQKKNLIAKHYESSLAERLDERQPRENFVLQKQEKAVLEEVKMLELTRKKEQTVGAGVEMKKETQEGKRGELLVKLHQIKAREEKKRLLLCKIDSKTAKLDKIEKEAILKQQRLAVARLKQEMQLETKQEKVRLREVKQVRLVEAREQRRLKKESAVTQKKVKMAELNLEDARDRKWMEKVTAWIETLQRQLARRRLAKEALERKLLEKAEARLQKNRKEELMAQRWWQATQPKVCTRNWSSKMEAQLVESRLYKLRMNELSWLKILERRDRIETLEVTTYATRRQKQRALENEILEALLKHRRTMDATRQRMNERQARRRLLKEGRLRRPAKTGLGLEKREVLRVNEIKHPPD